MLAIVAWNGNPPPWALVLIVLGIGMANALIARPTARSSPTWWTAGTCPVRSRSTRLR